MREIEQLQLQLQAARAEAAHWKKQAAELQETLEVTLGVKAGQLEVWPDASLTSLGCAYRELGADYRKLLQAVRVALVPLQHAKESWAIEVRSLLVIKVELHSANDRSVKEIGRAVIWNDETGDADFGNYQVAVCRDGSTDYERPQRRGRVKSYPRRANVWLLVYFALESAFDIPGPGHGEP